MTTISRTISGSSAVTVSSSVDVLGADFFIVLTTSTATPTYGGVSFRLLFTGGATSSEYWVWALANPLGGSNTLAITHVSNDVSCWAAYSGVSFNFDNPNYAQRGGNGTFDLTAGANSVVFAVSTDYNNNGPPADPPSDDIVTVDEIIIRQNKSWSANEEKLRGSLYQDVIPNGGTETYTLSGGTGSYGALLELTPLTGGSPVAMTPVIMV